MVQYKISGCIDKVYASSKQILVAAVSVNLDETQSAFEAQNQPQVAAQVNKGTELLNVVYYNDREFKHE